MSVDSLPRKKLAADGDGRGSNLAAHLDPHNTGVLVVDLSGRTGSRDAGFADQLANGGEQCLVM